MNILRIRAVTDDAPLSSTEQRTPPPASTATELSYVAEVPVDGDEWNTAASLHLRHAIGIDAPRYWYYVGQVAHASQALGLNRRDRVLLLGSDLTGADEIRDVRCQLPGLAAEACTALLASLIQGALKLASAPGPVTDRNRKPTAAKTIIALRGVRENGISPFWNGLGRHFYDRDPEQAIAEFGLQWQTDVAALLPQQPVIVSLLAEAAQHAVGAAAEDAGALREALMRSGFRASQHISIHDGGPIYEHEPAPRRDAWSERVIDAVDRLVHPRPWGVMRATGELWIIPAEADSDRLLVERDIAQRIGADPAARIITSLLGG